MHMRNLGLLILNNLKVTFRKKGNIITYIFLPVVGVLFSLVIHSTSSVSILNLGFTDHDRGMAALELKEKLAATEDFSVIDVDEEEISKKLLDFELDAVVVVPEGYDGMGGTTDIQAFSFHVAAFGCIRRRSCDF